MTSAKVGEAARRTGPWYQGRRYASTLRTFISVIIFITYFSTCSIYAVIISKHLMNVVEDYAQTLGIHQINQQNYLTSLLRPLVFVSWVRNLKYLASASMLAHICMGLGLGVTSYLAGTGGMQADIYDMIIKNLEWPECFSLTIFAIQGIGAVVPLENATKTPRSKLCMWLTKGMTGVTVVYFTLGFFGYLQFGEAVKDPITHDSHDDIAAQVVNIGIANAVFCTFGLQFLSCVEIAWNGMKKLAMRADLAARIIRTVLVTARHILAVPPVPVPITPFVRVIGIFCFSHLGISALTNDITHWRAGYDCANYPIKEGVSTIKDLAQRLTSLVSPTRDEEPLRVAGMGGIVSKANEKLFKSQNKEVIESSSIEKATKMTLETKVSENDLNWGELKTASSKRAFQLCDLDFSELRQDSDDDMSCSPASSAPNGQPPPPPMFFAGPPPPPPLPNFLTMSAEAKGCCLDIPAPPSKPLFTTEHSTASESDCSTIKKNKKTVKLFWREIKENPVPINFRPKIGGFFWDDLPDIPLDTKNLEHLFESRPNAFILKKLFEPKVNLILDVKRSNTINIVLKKLPTPQSIKAAIIKMDSTVINREDIEKVLAILPTEEEKNKIQDTQYANPNLPLGSAEQFLLTFSINELSSRLKLWVFKLDFDNLEKEIAEPLMDLMQGIDLLKNNMTFKVILSTLRSVGSFLNGIQVKGFRLEYLSKVMEVKDTVNKHPLLYHVCEMIIEKFPDTTDLFSEVGPVIRASKVDFNMLSANLENQENDCKAAWNRLNKIAQHDSQIFETKIQEFLTDAAERIILLRKIKKKVMNRFDKFLMFLGVPPAEVSKTKASEFLKVIAEFALQYKTTRERMLQQLERAKRRERNKARWKMVINVRV